MTLFGAIARWVQTATGPFRPVAVAGLTAAAVLVVALLPWTLHDPVAVVVLLIVAAIAVAAPLRVLQHRRALRSTLGDEHRVQVELTQLWDEGAAVTERLHSLDALRHGQGEDGRAAPRRLVRGLLDLRALRRALDVGDVADRARALYAPIRPFALWSTALAAVVIVAVTVLAPVAALISVIGVLLR